MSVARARKYIMFIKAHEIYKVGHHVQMRSAKADELIKKKIAKEYTGQWPPKKPIKYNLSDLG